MNSIEAGRELDALVAEKVMGLKVLKNKKGGWSIGEADYYDSYGEMILSNPLPNYSMDISAAWEVVEALRSKGFSVDVSSYPEDRLWLKPPYDKAPAKEWILTKDELQYQCKLSYFEIDYGSWISVADPCAKSPAHAICLAALEVLNDQNG